MSRECSFCNASFWTITDRNGHKCPYFLNLLNPTAAQNRHLVPLFPRSTSPTEKLPEGAVLAPLKMTFKTSEDCKVHVTQTVCYPCDVEQCPKICSNQIELEKHKENAHLLLNTAKCFLPDCSAVFLSDRTLLTHLERSHSLCTALSEEQIQLEKSKSKKVHVVPNYWLCNQCSTLLFGPKSALEHIKSCDVVPEPQVEFPQTVTETVTIESEQPVLNAAVAVNEEEQAAVQALTEMRWSDTSFEDPESSRAVVSEHRCGLSQRRDDASYEIIDDDDDAALACDLLTPFAPEETREEKLKSTSLAIRKSLVMTNQSPKPKKLSDHLIQRKKANDLECSVCGKQFTFKSYLERHKLSHSEFDSNPYRCHLCGKRFRCQSQLHVHKAQHTGKQGHTCAQCGKMFMFQSFLIRHEQTHTSKEPLQCEMCNGVFAVPSALESHKRRVHADDSETGVRCAVCKKRFLYPSYLKRHMAVHDKSIVHACPICFKEFSLRATLLDHLKSHLPGAKTSCLKQHNCAICGTSYKFESALQKHLQLCHVTELSLPSNRSLPLRLSLSNEADKGMHMAQMLRKCYVPDDNSPAPTVITAEHVKQLVQQMGSNKSVAIKLSRKS